MSLFHHTISSLAAKMGLYVASALPKEKLERFLEKIHPIHCGKDLIRLGPDADGGYLLPDDLEGIAACFSPGVDVESRFELQLAELGMDVFMADYSVDKPATDHPHFHFEKKYLASYDSGHFMTMDTWINSQKSLDPKSDLILQMDIEGAEYEVLQSISTQAINRFRIIVMEFHGWHQLYKPEVYQKANSVLDKLLLTHTVVHIHPNNYGQVKIHEGIPLYEYPEITLIRKDRIHNPKPVTLLPHPLDRDNVSKDAIRISSEWYLKSAK